MKFAVTPKITTTAKGYGHLVNGTIFVTVVLNGSVNIEVALLVET